MTDTNPRSYHGPIKLVIFDLAGTTIDYGSCAPAGAFVEGFRRQGIDITLSQAREPMGMGKWEHIQAIGQMPEVAKKWEAVHGHSLTTADIDTMYKEFVPVLLDVLDDYSQLIPGTVEAISELRQMGCQIGATTGYFEEAMKRVLAAAKKQGYEPDSAFCATQVSAGRPAPWLIYRTMENLGIYPPAAVVKVGDTKVDIVAGLNAGVWTVGVAKTGNGLGMTEAEVAALSTDLYEQKIAQAREQFWQAGARFVVDGVADIPAVVARINELLANGA